MPARVAVALRAPQPRLVGGASKACPWLVGHHMPKSLSLRLAERQSPRELGGNREHPATEYGSGRPDRSRPVARKEFRSDLGEDPQFPPTTWRALQLLRQLRRFSWEGEPRLSVRASVRNVRSRPRFPAEPTDLTAPEGAQLKQMFAGGGAKHLEPRQIFDETIARTR